MVEYSSLNLSFVTSFHENTDIKNIMKNIKRKTENTPSSYLKGTLSIK